MKTGLIVVVAIAVALVGYVFFVPSSPETGEERVGPEPHTRVTHFWTTPGIEPDTCVAAWLLTRIVEPGTRVEISERSLSGVPFDMPRAELRRRPGLATSDVVMQTYGVTDAFAQKIVAVIHELELMPWSTNSEPFFSRVRGGLAEAINASKTETVSLSRALEFLDLLRREHALGVTASDVPPVS